MTAIVAGTKEQHMLRSATSASLILAGLSTTAFAGPIEWKIGSFDMPESAVLDRDRSRIVLSVIGGNPSEADGNGALALLSMDGRLLDSQWVKGLDAPKGMAIIGNTLLVSDLTRIHEIDLDTGTVMRSFHVEGAAFLNDIASDEGQAFVSDFLANSIWRYEAGEVSVWLKDDKIAHPNGLYLDENRLFVGSWGQGLRDDFSTEHPGSLLAIDLHRREINILAENLGNLDGVARIGETLLVSDWIAGHLIEVDESGTATVVSEYPVGLADIAADGSLLLLPSMLEGTLTALTYP